MNFGLFVVEDVQESSSDLKKEFKTTKLPHFRFYPNQKTDSEKRTASFEVMIPKSKDPEEIKEAIDEEIQSNLVTDVKDVSE